jgi:hypothetical protein
MVKEDNDRNRLNRNLIWLFRISVIRICFGSRISCFGFVAIELLRVNYYHSIEMLP